MSVPDRSGRILRKDMPDLNAEFALMQRAQQQQGTEGFAGSAAAAGMTIAEIKEHVARTGQPVPVRGADIASGLRRKGIRKQYTGTAFQE